MLLFCFGFLSYLRRRLQESNGVIVLEFNKRASQKESTGRY